MSAKLQILPTTPETAVAKTSAEAAEAPNWDIQRQPGARTALTSTCKELRKRLLSASLEAQRAFLCDPREVHRQLFGAFVPDGLDVYAGCYRGEPGTPLEKRQTAVFYTDHPTLRAEDPVTPPSRVAERMEALAGYVEDTLEFRGDRRIFYKRSVCVFAQLLLIHPFLDGNGHIARLALSVLMHIGEVPARASWTIHPRPYDHAIGVCIQNFSEHPDLMEFYMRKWFSLT